MLTSWTVYCWATVCTVYHRFTEVKPQIQSHLNMINWSLGSLGNIERIHVFCLWSPERLRSCPQPLWLRPHPLHPLKVNNRRWMNELNTQYSDCVSQLLNQFQLPPFSLVYRKDSQKHIIMLAMGEHSTVLTREDNGVNFFIFSQDPND